MPLTDEQIKRAAMFVKMVELSGVPGMDHVCMMLNREPTHAELQVAKGWAKAFEMAATLPRIFDVSGAAAVREAMRS